MRMPTCVGTCAALAVVQALAASTASANPTRVRMITRSPAVTCAEGRSRRGGQSDADKRDLIVRGPASRGAGLARGRLKAGRDTRGARAFRVDGQVVRELARGRVDRDLRKPSRLRDPVHALVRPKVVEERGRRDRAVVETQ